MTTVAWIINQWGPWFVITGAVLTLCMVAIERITLAKHSRHLRDMWSRMPPAYRELCRKNLEGIAQGDPPLPSQTRIFKSLIWPVAQLAAGVLWLVFQSAIGKLI